MGEERSPCVGLEGRQASPCASVQAEAALEQGDAAFDARTKALETSVDPIALDHVSSGQSTLLAEGDVGLVGRVSLARGSDHNAGNAAGT